MVIVSSMLPFSLKNGPSFYFDFNERSSLLFFPALSSSFFSSSPLLYDLALQHALECVDVLCRRQAPSLSCCCPKMAEHRSFFFLFPFFFSCVSLGCVVVLSGTSRISHFIEGRFPIFSGPEGDNENFLNRVFNTGNLSFQI